MFGKFLGKQNQKSSLPKNQIEVVCPLCGAVQREPRLVVTTFCRSCGEHLRIEKKRVEASSKINPVPSAIYPAVSETSVEIQKESAEEKANIESQPTSGVGKPSGIRSTSPFTLIETKPVATGRAAPQSTLLKMKEQGSHGQHNFKKVDCFDCHNHFKVGRSAKSSNCPSCGAYICLENFDINLSSTKPIRTRGDVLIRKTGNVSTTEIHCRNLTVHGSISGNIDCSGDFIIHSKGKHIGTIRCHRIVIEKSSDIHFLNTIVADEAEVRSRVTGNIQCHGPLLISATGEVHGDVTAHSVSIEPGGQLDGAMNILRSGSAKQAAKSSQLPATSEEAPAPAIGRRD